MILWDSLDSFANNVITCSDDELLFLQLTCRSRVNKIAGSPIVLILNKLILGNHHRKLQLISSCATEDVYTIF